MRVQYPRDDRKTQQTLTSGRRLKSSYALTLRVRPHLSTGPYPTNDLAYVRLLECSASRRVAYATDAAYIRPMRLEEL